MFKIKHRLFMANEAKQNPSKTESKRRDSTADYPMMSLREICDFVQVIWEKGVQSESMPTVARACGYSSATSTGFYRRMVGARLFKMAESQSARLTRLSLDYLKPDSGDAKTKALREAVRSVPGYQPLFEKYTGSKLNQEIIKNGIARATNLTDECALICSKVFIESLRFAGELDADYTLLGSSRLPADETLKASDGNGSKQVAPQKPAPMSGDGELETYYLTLDAGKGRRVIVQAPPSVTPSELKRIQDWLSFQLLVEEKKGAEPSQ
jgi:hypothetical protein